MTEPQTLPSPAIIQVPGPCKVILTLDGVELPAITLPVAGVLEIRLER